MDLPKVCAYSTQYIERSAVEAYERDGTPIPVHGPGPLYDVIRFEIDRVPVAVED